ncbi:unnamed protein product [Paramecium octaurelia]|uniref:Uncharacterized protein n=1 Tax=Paramecium octaurelia TaxID=43137 RepID=A0A8S1S2F2_PAROT|nr:unnamed protein product [Paramecium octaurelia]
MKIMKNLSIETDKSDKSPQIMRRNNEHFVSYSVDDKYTCQCNLCISSLKKKIPKPLDEPQQVKGKQNSNDRDFIFIVTRLVQESFGRTLNIQIQDTVYFEKGEPQSILQSIKDGIDRPYQLRVQQWKGSLQKLMQYLNNRRKKIANTNMQLDLIQLNEKQQSALSNVNKEQINNISEKSKEAVLVKFDDDSAQIMTESEFFLLMSKRKGDKFWHKIFYIQNYIKQRAFLTHRIHFNRKRDLNHKLFDRSAMETRIIRGEVISASTEYISQTIEDEFLRQLKERSTFEYLRYITFKIVQFLDILDDTIINDGIFEWNQDDRGDFQFFNAFQLTYEKRAKEERLALLKPHGSSNNNNGIDTDSAEEEKEIDPRKMFNRKYQLRQMARNAQNKLKLKQQHLLYKDTPKVSQWQTYMQDDYLALLKSVGIDKNQFNLKEDNQSELTFKQLHPEIQIDFQKIMKDQSLFNKLKKQLFTDNNKSKPISQSKMLNSFFLTPEKKKQRSRTVSKQPRQDLISTLNQSSIKKSIRSVDRTVSEFRYDISRNGKRSTKTLNKILGLANS